MSSEWNTESASLENPSGPYKNVAVACCCVAIASLVPVVLKQLNVIDNLPDPPGWMFDSTKIVTADGSYKLGIPDGILGIGSYSLTLALLLNAGPSQPLLQKALRSKLALDATMAVRHAKKQVSQFKRICSWCMVTAIATAGVVHYARRSRVMQGVRRD